MSKKALIIRNAAPTDFGGAERVPIFIAKELTKYNFEVLILSRSSKLLSFAEQEGVPSKRSFWWSRQNWSGAKALLFPVYIAWQVILFFYYVVVFRNERPSVVHLQSKDDFIAGTFAAKLLNIPVFWSDYADLKHIFMNHSTWYKNPIGKLVYFSAQFTSKIIVVSKEDLRAVAKLLPDGSVKDKLLVIYNGVFDTYKDTKKSIDFISTARLVTDKGIRELLEAFALVRKDNPKATLAVVGDGPESNTFHELAKKLNVSGVTFYGHQKNPLEFLEKSRIFVLPTYHEGFSIALLEACMQGLAVITTNVGGNPEIIDNKKNGLLVKARNSHDLYLAMQELMQSPKNAQRLGKSARAKYLASFNFETIIREEFLPLYEDRYV